MPTWALTGWVSLVETRSEIHLGWRLRQQRDSEGEFWSKNALVTVLALSLSSFVSRRLGQVTEHVLVCLCSCGMGGNVSFVGLL